MKTDLITALYDYTFWAYARVWACIEPLSDEQFVSEIDYSIGSVRNQMLHVVGASLRWMGRLTGGEVPQRLVFTDYPTKAAARARWDEAEYAIQSVVRAFSDAQLDETVPWSLETRGIVAATPRWQVLLHVANHATDHRSQILAQLASQFHVPTFEQDMIFFFTNR